MPAAYANYDVLAARIAPVHQGVVRVMIIGESVASSFSWASLEPQIGDAFRHVLAEMCGITGIGLTFPTRPGEATQRQGWYPLNKADGAPDAGGANWRSIADSDALQAYAISDYTGESYGVMATSDANTDPIASAYRIMIASDRVGLASGAPTTIPAVWNQKLYRYQRSLEMASWRVYWSAAARATAGTTTWNVYGGNAGPDIDDPATWKTDTPIGTLDQVEAGVSALTRSVFTAPAGYQRGLMFRRDGYASAGGTDDEIGLRLHAIAADCAAADHRGFHLSIASTFGGEIISSFTGATQLGILDDYITGEDIDIVVPTVWFNDANGAATDAATYLTEYAALCDQIIASGAVPLCLGPMRSSLVGAAITRLAAYDAGIRAYAEANSVPFISLWDFPSNAENGALWDGVHLANAGFAPFQRYLARVLTRHRNWRELGARAFCASDGTVRTTVAN